MRRRSLLLSAALLAAAPAYAQPTIQPGQTVEGELSRDDPSLQDRSHYDLWRFEAEPDHVYRVTLRSSDFDAYLAVGPHAGPGCADCPTDDDGAGGTDAALPFISSQGGLYEIRANSYGGEKVGRYTLVLEDEGALEPPDTVTGSGRVVMNRPLVGRLEQTDEKGVNGAYIDTYTGQGQAGDEFVITLESDDFDAFVKLGNVEHGACRPVESDDNSGGGTNSRMRIRLPRSGDFHIHVSSRRSGETGAYTLTVIPG